MHARNSFKNNKVLEENYEETLKKELDFFLCSQFLFMDKIMKNKWGPELVTSLSMGCKTCLEKFLFQ